MGRVPPSPRTARDTGTEGVLDTSVYERASRMRVGHRARLVRNTVDQVSWLTDRPGFVYRTRRAAGLQHMLVDPIARTRVSIPDSDLEALPRKPAFERFQSTSPNGAYTLERRGHDLWLVENDTQTATRLTSDGTPEHAYGTMRDPDPDGEARRPAVAFWSPDSRHVVSQRMDYRGVRSVTLVESAPLDGGLPREHQVRDAYPGDAHIPQAEVLIVDAGTGAVIPAQLPPLPCTHSSPLLRGDLWWDPAGTSIYLVASSRDWLSLTLYQLDPATGAARALVTETGERRVRPSQLFHQRPNIRVLTDAEGAPEQVIWFSERDGWGHLYLYDASSGECLRQITRGECITQEILRVDQARRLAWISVSGLIEEDPYRNTLCRVHLDTGELERLFEDSLVHRQMVPPGDSADDYFIDIASTVAIPPVATVRDWDGNVLLELEAADARDLEALGWRPPERFRATGADGETPIYGTIYFPLDFDPTRSYPVLDHLYPGPQIHRAQPHWEDDEVEPFAAIGLIGLMIDGRGTTGRGRVFHDASWENIGDGSGLDDHVAAIRELALTRPWLDIDRVGVYGHSAGGLAALRAMELFPEFYGVGIAASGRYDGRLVMAMILEAYDHPTDREAWARSSAVERAGDITGNLLLVHGEMDKAVIIQQAYRVIDRLIAADRDFDLLVVPGDDHVFSRHAGYVERRLWDYYVRHLMGMEPPAGFRMD